MGVQFGRLSLAAVPQDRDYIDAVGTILAPWGPDGIRLHVDSRIAMLSGALHTSEESRHEIQPHVTPSGVVVTWDGCLDNRAELISDLRTIVDPACSDVSLVAAAYVAWGNNCFAKFIGAWAMAVWDPRIDTVILGRDAIGIRHLYYSLDGDYLTWSTVLDPLVQLAPRPFTLSEEYLAGWISFFPAAHLTPYAGVRSVRPSYIAIIVDGREQTMQYWNFDPGKRIVDRSDRDCEEQFRELFGQAVRRTLRSDRPVLAELSGGMDSSSIVCMADELLRQGLAQAPRLHTVSYYDDTEPDWNELPCIERIEQLRGSKGLHIDLSSQDAFALELEAGRLDVVPGTAVGLGHAVRQYRSFIERLGARVVLSGLGGDEVLGGVPTPLPELTDLLVTGRWVSLIHQLKKWSLAKRKPWFHLLGEALAAFLPPAVVGTERTRRPATWLRADFARRNWTALTGYRSRTRLSGGLPSFQDSLITIEGLRRSIGTVPPPFPPLYEKRYPYLDRDLLEYLVSLPPQQLLRPGQRRSLMRRALVNLVPAEILGRKRKAFVNRTLVTSLCRHLPKLLPMADEMESMAFGVVDRDSFKEALQCAATGADISPLPLFRILVVETWLKNLIRQGIVRRPNLSDDIRPTWRRSPSSHFRPTTLSAEAIHKERR